MGLFSMANPFTDYYRAGGIGGLKIGRQAYQGVREIPWDIQRSLCVNTEKKIIYFKPGKAAGTSIFRVLLQPMGGWIIQKDNPIKFTNWINNITDDEFNQYYKFIFVRNPYSRLVSVWNDKKTQYNLDPDFKRFVTKRDNIFTNDVPRGLHLQKQSSLIKTPSGITTNLDFIGKVETIDEDWKTFCTTIGIPHRPMVTAQKRIHKPYREYYDSISADSVYNIYKQDFEIFNYSKEL